MKKFFYLMLIFALLSSLLVPFHAGATEMASTPEITEDASKEKENYFPEDLFSSAEACGQYFVNADHPDLVYEQEDGEWVMHVPVHVGYDYMWTLEPIPYDTYTVTFDFYLNMLDDPEIVDELDFLFGMPSEGVPFHQIALINNMGFLELLHYKHTGEIFEYYELDKTFFDIYDEEFWLSVTVEITPDEVSVYYDDDWIVTLEDTAGCVGENGHIGIRGGSKGGWRIKNLSLVEGTFEENEPVATPETTPATSPSASSATTAPSTIPDANRHSGEGSSNWIWIVGIAAAVTVCGGIAGFVIYRKKK